MFMKERRGGFVRELGGEVRLVHGARQGRKWLQRYVSLILKLRVEGEDDPGSVVARLYPNSSPLFIMEEGSFGGS
jgi:hypothetical protein